jgi:hypothetical protein
MLAVAAVAPAPPAPSASWAAPAPGVEHLHVDEGNVDLFRFDLTRFRAARIPVAHGFAPEIDLCWPQKPSGTRKPTTPVRVGQRPFGANSVPNRRSITGRVVAVAERESPDHTGLAGDDCTDG